MTTMDAAHLQGRLENGVSHITYNVTKDKIYLPLTFTIEFYLNRIIENPEYRVKHITTLFTYNLEEFKSVILSSTKLNEFFNDYEGKKEWLELIDVNECLNLNEILQIINSIIDNKNIKGYKILVIEDIDDSFNILSYQNYSLACSMIVSIVRNLRKLAQRYGIMVFLIQKGKYANYSSKFIGKYINTLTDHHVQLDGEDIDIESVF